MVFFTSMLFHYYRGLINFNQRDSGPKGANDLELKHEDGIEASRLGFETRGWDMSSKAKIFEPQD